MEREIEVRALLPLELDGSVAGPLSFFLAAASGPLPPSCSFRLVPGDVSSSLSRYIASKAASRSFVSFLYSVLLVQVRQLLVLDA